MENFQDFSEFQRKVSELFNQSNRSEDYLSKNLGTLAEICKFLRTSIKTGVDRDSIPARMSIFGMNRLSTFSLIKQKAFSMTLDQSLRFLLFILLVSTISKYYIVIKIDVFDSLLIFSSFLLIYCLSFMVDVVIESNLNRFNAFQMFSVTRDSKKSKVFSEDLVVGDLIHLRPSQVLPADILIVTSEDLRVNESFYTGELPQSPYEGSFVKSNSEITTGKLTGLIVAVGSRRTSFRLTGSNVFIENQTEFQKNVEKLSDSLTFYTFLLGTVVFCVDFYCLVQNAVKFGWLERHLTDVFDFFLFQSAFFVMAVPDIFKKMIYLVFSYNLKEFGGCLDKIETFERLGRLDVLCIDASNFLVGKDVQVKFLSFGNGECFDFKNFVNVPNFVVEKIGEVLNVFLEIKKNQDFVLDEEMAKAFKDLMEQLTGNKKRTEPRFDLKFLSFDEVKKSLICAIEEKKKIQVLAFGPCKSLISYCSSTLNCYNTKTSLGAIEKLKILEDFVKPKKNSSMKTLSLAYKDLSLQDWTLLGGEKGEIICDSLTNEMTLICSLALNSVLGHSEVMSIRKTLESGVDVRIMTENSSSESLPFAKKLGILPNNYKKSPNDGLVVEGSDLLINHKILLNSPNFMEKDHPINKSMSQIKLLTSCNEQQRYLFLNKLNELYGEVAVVKRKKGRLDWNFDLVFNLKQLNFVPSAFRWSKNSKKMVAFYIQGHVSMFCTAAVIFVVVSWKEGRILHEFYRLVFITAASLVMNTFVLPFKRPELKEFPKNSGYFVTFSKTFIDLSLNLIVFYFLVNFGNYFEGKEGKIEGNDLDQRVQEIFFSFALVAIFSVFFNEIFDLKFWKMPFFCVFVFFGFGCLTVVASWFSFLQMDHFSVVRLCFAFVIVGNSSYLKLKFN